MGDIEEAGVQQQLTDTCIVDDILHHNVLISDCIHLTKKTTVQNTFQKFKFQILCHKFHLVFLFVGIFS